MDLCRKVGFEMKEVKCVNAFGWENDFDETDKKVKDILIILPNAYELTWFERIVIAYVTKNKFQKIDLINCGGNCYELFVPRKWFQPFDLS